MATWTKLRDGSWGIKGPKTEIAAGARVQVQKKDGEIQTVTIAKVVWSGDDVAIASIVAERREGGNGGGANAGGKTCADCGKRLVNGGKMCRDSSGFLGECCPQCARMSQFERSFC